MTPWLAWQTIRFGKVKWVTFGTGAEQFRPEFRAAKPK